MTVLVGVVCEDGVVVGSDSSVTFTAGGPHQKTIEQLAQKTFKTGDDLIFSCTGAVGQGQRFEDVLAKLKAAKKFANLKNLDVGREIAKAATGDFAYTDASKGTFGALVGFWCATGFRLCEFPASDFQPEMKTSDLWFCSMGAGQPITDPFLALIKKSLFRDSRPKLNEGVFLAYWALEHAIELNTGGIQGPPQLATLFKGSGGHCKAKLFKPEDFGEHKSMVNGAEEHLRLYRDRLAGNISATSVAPLPTPPSKPPQEFR